ncbi:ATP-binding protein [Streptomyces sp. NPDC055992]|uniref:ATP-binding protein n=1 Tax=Streptomyces sp. NPDC055992 TaxID=3345673 RepID=UPI0035D55E7A
MPAYTETLPRVPESVLRARNLVDLSLSAWGVHDDQGAAKLVVSELVANTVQHARRSSFRVTVTWLGDNRVRVAVVDLSRTHPVRRSAGSDDESGRGLDIVDALSRGQWGVDSMRWGKRVRADLVFEETTGE